MGIRVLIYDLSDRTTVYAKIKDMVKDPIQSLEEPPDITDLRFGLSPIWATGAKLYDVKNRFDAYRGFFSWTRALQWLGSVGGDAPIDEIQYWGHGTPGKVWLHGDYLHHRSPVGATYGGLLREVRNRLHPKSLVWFRVCSLFCGDRGIRFASEWSKALGCTVAAHTHIIGAWQGGLKVLQPGEDPYWDPSEGIKSGEPGAPQELAWSRPWTKDTIFCLRDKIPTKYYNR